MNDQIRAISEYVYTKHVDNAAVDDLDELEAIRILERYYTQPANREDGECVYLGILYFELGFEQETEEEQLDFFRRAKYWLDHHKTLTGEEWDAVDDRLGDLEDIFEAKGIDLADAAKAPEAPEEGDEPVAVEDEAFAPIVQKSIEDHGTMMYVPGGRFLFGTGDDPINVPAFYIDKHPVTNRQYEAFCRATGYRFPKQWSVERFKDPRAPVVGVSVNDALKFSRWVGKSLPTEEQWEKACRGVDGRRFPWGDDPATNDHACHGRDPVEQGTCPVLAHEAGESPYGVHDMAGNIWEWTATTDSDPETVHIIKGGCYNDPPELLDATIRLAAAPKDKFETIGFRCVKPA